MKPKKINIAFDARMIFHSGIGTYIRSLLKEMVPCKEFSWTLLGDPKSLVPLFPGIEIRETNAPIYSIREQMELTGKASGFDLFHAPHYNAPIFISSPLIVTVHDLIHFRFPQYFGSGLKLRAARFILQQALHRAKKVITVSRATQSDLLNRFTVSPGKVRVIHEAPADLLEEGGPVATEMIKQKFRLPDEFLLYVGNLKPHKNIPLLIRAVRSLREEGLKVNLVLVGKRDQNSVSAQELDGLLNSEGIFPLGALSREDLIAVYSLARGFVMPSLWEGFGLPVLEAYGFGLPVAASGIPALEELAGPQGLFFDPESLEDMKRALRKLATDPALRRALAQNGRERLKLFSWKKCAEETLETYREVLGQ